MSNKSILIADIGGTNARFAIADRSRQRFSNAQTLEAANFERLIDAIDSYLQNNSINDISNMCLAVAGPVVDEKVDFPNSHWHVDCTELRAKYGIKHANLLNDWEAISYSLSSIDQSDLINIGGDWSSLSDGDFTIGALGPGSGLGVSGLIRRNGQLHPMVTEGGHVGFAPENKLQIELLSLLQAKFGKRISRERLLSGPGIGNIYAALEVINKSGQSIVSDRPFKSAAKIAIEAFENRNPLALQTFDVFFEILGQVAGDIALATGAYDGIFVGGGIALRYPEQLLQSKFRHGFECKGRHSHLMENIPTWLISHNNPGLLGASVFATSSTNHEPTQS
ncbi:MAG: glucokinase [Gammaproteobacteria bacterium]|nr:glucokinase [Gammaproteobacteria bacterium]